MKKSIFKFFIVLFFLFLAGCVSIEKSSQTSDVWTGNITGMAEGKIKLFVLDVKDGTGVKKVESKIFVTITNADNEDIGDMVGTLSGKIENNILNADITGHAYVLRAKGRINGGFTGEMSETRGSGEWTIIVSAKGNPKFTGKWTLEKK